MNRLLLPSELLIKQLKQSNIHTMQVWLWLKFKSDGQILQSFEIVNELAKSLKLSPSTIYRLLKYLKDLNWIGFNQKTKMMYIRSINTICKIEGIKKQKSYWLFENHLNQLKKFAFAVGVSDIIRQKIAKDRERSNKRGGHIKFPSYALSISYISKRYTLSTSFVKSLLKSNPFLSKKSNYIQYLINEKPVKSKDFYLLREYGPTDKIRIIKGFVVLNGPNYITCKLTTKRRRFRTVSKFSK